MCLTAMFCCMLKQFVNEIKHVLYLLCLEHVWLQQKRQWAFTPAILWWQNTVDLLRALRRAMIWAQIFCMLQKPFPARMSSGGQELWPPLPAWCHILPWMPTPSLCGIFTVALTQVHTCCLLQGHWYFSLDVRRRNVEDATLSQEMD